jgi:hypothetical protein
MHANSRPVPVTVGVFTSALKADEGDFPEALNVTLHSATPLETFPFTSEVFNRNTAVTRRFLGCAVRHSCDVKRQEMCRGTLV